MIKLHVLFTQILNQTDGKYSNSCKNYIPTDCENVPKLNN